MIPDLNHSGTLPPFLPGKSSININSTAPYKTSLIEVAKRFANNDERIEIFKGYLSYREELRTAGFDCGFQWIDGSFVENSEHTRGRPPNDIDILTFATRPTPYIDKDKWKQFLDSRPDLFDPEESKKAYHCDAYFVDLMTNPIFLIHQTRYWFGLFSHQRSTYLWKGMLEVPLIVDDADVVKLLSKGGSHAA